MGNPSLGSTLSRRMARCAAIGPRSRRSVSRVPLRPVIAASTPLSCVAPMAPRALPRSSKFLRLAVSLTASMGASPPPRCPSRHPCPPPGLLQALSLPQSRCLAPHQPCPQAPLPASSTVAMCVASPFVTRKTWSAASTLASRCRSSSARPMVSGTTSAASATSRVGFQRV